MMRRLLRPITVLLLLAALDVHGQQSRVFYGPTVGYEFSVPLLLQRAPGSINYEPGFSGTGTSYSHTAIFGAQVLVPSAWTGLLGYSARVALHATSGNFTSDQFVPGVSLDTATLADIDPNRYRFIAVDFTAATIAADAQLRLSFGERFLGGVGLWTSYRLSGHFLRTERPWIIPPDIDPSDATIVTGGDRIASYDVGYGGIFSLSARLPWTSRLAVLPEITSRLDAVALRRGMGVKALTIGAGVSLLFDGDDTPVPIARADELEGADASTPVDVHDDRFSGDTSRYDARRLEARIELVAGDTDEPAIVETEEVINRRLIALPRIVELAPSSLEIAGGFARLQAHGADGFTTRALAGLDLAGHCRHLLNVLGLRMREAPDARLALVGTSAPSEPQSLGRARAEFVRDYLVSVWGIASARITIGAVRADQARLELDGSPELWSAPLLSQWRTRRYRMPPVSVERTIVADAGVRRWTLELWHGRRRLGRYTSDSTSEDPAVDLRFLAGGDSTRAIDPIVAMLDVEDSLGRHVTTSDRLAVIRASSISRRMGQAESVEVIGFDHGNDSGSTARSHREAARRAASLLRDGAEVRVGSIGRIQDAALAARALDVARAAEEFLAAANERGVRIERFVAQREPVAMSDVPPGICISVELPPTEGSSN